MGPLICDFFSTDKLENFLEICNNVKKLVDKPHNLENQKNLIKRYVGIYEICVDTSSLFYHLLP